MPITLSSGQSCLATVADLLHYELHIPPFQRPYDWESKQVLDLAGDMFDAGKKKVPLFLGMVVLCPRDLGGYDIIDGQQRLTSLMLALATKGAGDRVLLSRDGGFPSPWITPRHADTGFLRALINGKKEGAVTLSQRRLADSYAILKDATGIDLDTILDARLIVYVSPSMSGATGLFERINLRGKDVSQFDLVKNKLIEWAAVESRPAARDKISAYITSRYDTLYQRLDPAASSMPFDADKLLKIHWILFTDKSFGSSDRVLEKLNMALDEVLEQGGSILAWIERYLGSLVEVTEAWVAVERPYEVQSPYSKAVKQAILNFARLDREGEWQPLIIAALIQWGEGAKDLIRYAEIDSFRSALARKNSNSGRSPKWRFARLLYQNSWRDAAGTPISTARAAVHQAFWAATPYWDRAESALLEEGQTREQLDSHIYATSAFESTEFYGSYRRIIHYLFWNYGVHLPTSSKWAKQTREDINPLQESVWFDSESGFRTWDIEHIYPQNAADRDTRTGKAHAKEMDAWLHHLGNLTVLPIRDNRGLRNDPFEKKLAWLREQRKVSFNELLALSDYRGNLMSRPHWGPNNCRKRQAEIKYAADQIWGTHAIQQLGVGKYDQRIDGYDVYEDDDES
jgi:hypothetical protein